MVRARIVLMGSERRTIAAIRGALSVDRQVVRRWCKRFLETGFDGLKDRSRTGRPRRLTPNVWQKAARVIVQPPTKFGLPFTRWSVRELSRFLEDRFGMRVSRSSLSRLLRAVAQAPSNQILVQSQRPGFRPECRSNLQDLRIAAGENDRCLHRRKAGNSGRCRDALRLDRCGRARSPDSSSGIEGMARETCLPRSTSSRDTCWFT